MGTLRILKTFSFQFSFFNKILKRKRNYDKVQNEDRFGNRAFLRSFDASLQFLAMLWR